MSESFKIVSATGEEINTDKAHRWGGIAAQRQKSIAERVWEKVNKNGPTPKHMPHLGPCWEWVGAKTMIDRPIITIGGRKFLAYRVAWELANGQIPPGLLVCHHCDNPLCLNIERHIFIGTQKDNCLDTAAKGRNPGQRGELSGKAKLNEAQVREIKQLLKSGLSQRKIAALFPMVGRGGIWCIYKGETWSHIAI